MVAGTEGNLAEYLRMMGPGLPLPSALEITAPGTEEDDDNHGQDRRKSGRKAGPMHIDEADPMIGLVDGGFFMHVLGVDQEVSVVSDDGAVRLAILGDVLLNKELSFVVIDDALPIAE